MAQHAPQKKEIRLSFGLAIYFGYILLLVTVPYGFPPEASLSTAAAEEGYNVLAAHYVVLAWSLVAVLGSAIYWRWAHRPDSPATEATIGGAATVQRTGKTGYFLEAGCVFLVFVALYAPPFLARYGPYIEDSLFLNYLLRMHCGLTPYRDFQFIYGPLMLYPAFYWTEIFGYSMSSFFGYLSLLEGLQFAVLILVLQRYLPTRSKRYAVFIVLIPILFNTLLGLNSNGVRELGAVLIILVVTAHPRSLWAVTGGAILLGLQMAYSHEYGFACLAAMIGMYGVMAVRREGWWTVLSAAVLAVGSGLTWFTAARLLMGDSFSAYLTSSLQLLGYFSQGGGAFRFYWTLNSLALFGLLTIACVRVGSGLFAQRRRPLNKGDRLILAGLLFALVALKGGLNRSDLWHLNPAFLVLLFAFLLSPSTRVFAASPWGSQRIALALIGVVSVTHLVGIAPTGSFYAAGYVRGLVDVLVLSKPTARESAETRVPSVQVERTYPDPNILGLGEYLAEDTRSESPVFFYNELWLLPIGVGVCREDYSLDNFMHGEDRQLAQNYLKQNPDALIVIGREAFERLYGLADQSEFPEFEVYNPKTLTKAIASWTSSVHYRTLAVENRVLDRMWKREAGDYIRSRYEVDAEFGMYLVLSRSDQR